MSEPRVLEAMRLGGHARRCLTQERRAGRIISRFRNGLNVLLDDSVGSALISIQTPNVPLHPFGVEAPRLPTAANDEDLLVESGHVTFGSGQRLEFGTAPVDDLRIDPLTPGGVHRARARWPVLVELLDEVAGGPARDPLLPRVDGLLAAWRTNHEAHVLPGLLGLGTGSTPAGDDVLVGLLAGWTGLSEVDGHARNSLEILTSVLAGMALRRATQMASGQMIEAALDGSFPEPLRDLVRILGASAADEDVRAAATRVLGLGATSGEMMLQGFMAAFD